MVDKDNQKPKDGAYCAPINNICSSLFNDVKISLNDVQINPHSSYYATKAYITTLLNFNSLSQYTTLAAGGFYHDEVRQLHLLPLLHPALYLLAFQPDTFQDIGVGVNYGMNDRRSLFLKSGVGHTTEELLEFHGEQVTVVSKLISDFMSCSTPIIPGKVCRTPLYNCAC